MSRWLLRLLLTPTIVCIDDGDDKDGYVTATKLVVMNDSNNGSLICAWNLIALLHSTLTAQQKRCLTLPTTVDRCASAQSSPANLRTDTGYYKLPYPLINEEANKKTT